MKKKYILYFINFISLFIIFFTIYIKKYFSTTIEQLLFSINSSGGASNNVLSNGAIYVFLRVFIVLMIIILINIFTKRISFKIKRNISIVVLIFSIIFMCYNFGLFSYIGSLNKKTDLYEKYYKDPETTNITFNEKRNLIYIIVESLESTSYSKEFMPNMDNLAKSNISFNGMNMVDGTNWTAASMFAQSSGVPIKVYPKNIFRKRNLTGAYTLGEVLEENGYKNYLLMGSKASFGNRDVFFKEHGNYEIYDYDYAKETNLIDKDYKVWWGYEDSKLYSFAKDKLSTLEEPFNFTMLTADTHFVDGYQDKSCTSNFDSKYKNSFSCTDKMLNEFINWIKKQDFYKNTTIVVVGDHLVMQEDLYKGINDRTIYNAFINTNIDSINDNRIFTVMDLYPTTIASIGGIVEGDRLGLGTNLFSDKKTIPEEIGFDKFNKEINLYSKYYINYIN